MNKKIIIAILIILHISYLILFGKYIFVETLLYRENGKKYYVSSSMTRYITTEMSNDFIPKELSRKSYKRTDDYIDNIKKKRTTNISILYRIFEIMQIATLFLTIVYMKKDKKGAV